MTTPQASDNLAAILQEARNYLDLFASHIRQQGEYAPGIVDPASFERFTAVFAETADALLVDRRKPPEIGDLQHSLKAFSAAAATLAGTAERVAAEIPATADAIAAGYPFGEDLHELSLEIRSWTDHARIRLETLTL